VAPVYYGSRRFPAAGGVLYSRRPAMECITCRKDEAVEETLRLNKCPICFKQVCDDCAVRNFGRLFCSKLCSNQFFFGDDED
jgi:hypothetical protein